MQHFIDLKIKSRFATTAYPYNSILFYIFKDIVCGLVCTYTQHDCPGACQSQKRVLGALELELVLGNEPGSSTRGPSAPNF